LIDGHYTEWVDLVVDIEGEYKNGKKDGPWIEKAADPKTKCAGNYINGERDGVWTFGMSKIYGKCNGSFILGKKHGDWFYYNYKGKRIRSEKWDNGELLETKYR
jgi:antitoxin component YwqK of YwqJK toxin-antitoxin module